MIQLSINVLNKVVNCVKEKPSVKVILKVDQVFLNRHHPFVHERLLHVARSTGAYRLSMPQLGVGSELRELHITEPAV